MGMPCVASGMSVNRVELRIPTQTHLGIRLMTSLRSASLLAVALATLAGVAAAQSSGGGYAITKQAIVSGGGSTAGGSYGLVGSAGQAHAATQSGGSYTLTGGFHAPSSGGPPPSGDLVFRSGFE